MSSQTALHEAPAQPSFLATRRGKLMLAFLCMVGFLDFVDASIVNVALPSIRRDLHFSLQSVPIGQPWSATASRIESQLPTSAFRRAFGVRWRSSSLSSSAASCV